MNTARMRQIRASAGSGKTYELTRCYVEKLAQIPAESCTSAAARGILAITFTNAAANEMRQRVIERLKNAVLAQNDALVDAALAARWLDIFLEDLSALNIRTIDSLLHQIIRLSALDLGISPDYTTEFSTRNAMKPYLDLILEQGSEDVEINAMIRETCDAIIQGSEKHQFVGEQLILRRLSSLFELALKGELENVVTSEEIDNIIGNAANRFKTAATRLLDKADPDKYRWNKKALENVSKYAGGDFGNNLSKTCIGEKHTKLFVAATTPPSGMEPLYAEFLDTAQTFYRLKNLLENARIWTGCVKLAKKIALQFTEDMRKTGVFPQILASHKAMQVLEPLGAVSEAFCRMGNCLTHFLVDEFQDTSDEQWAVLRVLALEAISRGGSLLWVGDPKQSIYGWRGGNSTLFDAVGKDQELLRPAGKPDVYLLDTNWRSDRKIIDYNNTFFSTLASQQQAQTILGSMLAMDTDQAILAEGAKRLSAIYADVRQKPHKSESGYVQVESVCANTTEEINALAQERLCEILLEIHKRRPWSDMLVLVRKRNFARQAAIRMEASGIPFITENGLMLNENCLILEIIAFLTFLNNTDDDLAFWAILNGEIFKKQPEAAELASADLPGLAATRGKTRLYKAFARRFPDIWEKFFAPFVTQRGILTPYDIVMEWQHRMEITKNFPHDTTMLRRFMETVHLAESNGAASIAAFLEYWDEQSAAERAPMPENMDAVRIMTIHKAKGLQAPVAILPDTGFNIKAPDAPMLYQIDSYKAIAQLKKGLGPIYQQEMTQQALEALNLLYVAMTRPVEELYVLQTMRTQARPNNTEKAVRQLAAAAADLASTPLAGAASQQNEVLGQEPDATGQYSETRSAKQCINLEKKQFPPNSANQINLENANNIDASPCPDANSKNQPVASAWPNDWQPMDWLPKLKIHRNHARADHLTAKERGTLIHAALENLALDADFNKSVQIALLAAERSTGIITPKDNRQELLDALAWLAELPQSREWLAHGFPEHSFLLTDGSLLRVDLLVPLADDRPLIIDYKSGTPSAKHLQQMHSYLDALQSSGQFSAEPTGLIIYLDLHKFQQVTLVGAGPITEQLSPL